MLVHDLINLLYYEHWTDKQKYFYRWCGNGSFFNNSSNAHAYELLTLMILRKLVSLGASGLIDRKEISIDGSITSPEVMWTLIIKLPYTAMKFYSSNQFEFTSSLM